MNTKVLVPNIILTNNPVVAQAFSDPAAKYTSFSKFKQDLVDSEQYSNPSFIILETTNTDIISFNLNAKAEEQATVSLEIISRGDEFEIKLFDSFLNQYKTNSYYKDFPKTTYYLAFGVGDDLSYWSNFIAVTLASAATFQEFEKPKTIQLNFAVGLGVHESLDLIISKVLPNESEAFHNMSIVSLAAGPFSKKDWDLSKEYKDAIVGGNKGLILNYMLGFTKLDFLYKKAIRDYIQNVFLQKVNVFVVSEDLPRLALNRSRLPGEKQFIAELNRDNIDWEKALEDAGGLVGINFIPEDYKKAKAATDKDAYIVAGYRRIKEILDGFLGTETNIPDGSITDNGGRNNTGEVKFTSLSEETDSKDYQQIKNSIQSKVTDLVLGLGRLCGETATTTREIDAAVIANFIKNCSPGSVTKQKPIATGADFVLEFLSGQTPPQDGTETGSNPSSEKPSISELFDPSKPVLLIGPKSLVRAILYGEQADGNQLLNTPYPTNEFTKKLVDVWKSLNLYESQSVINNKNYLEAILSDTNNNQNNDQNKALTKLPTFRYNLTNANILSIKSEQSNILNGLLFAGFNALPEFYSQAAQITTDKKTQKARANARVNARLLDALIAASFPQDTNIRIPYTRENSRVSPELYMELYSILSEDRDKAETKVREAFEELKKSGDIVVSPNQSQEESSQQDFDGQKIRTLASILSEAFSSDEQLQKDYLISNITLGAVDDLLDPALLFSKLLDSVQKLSFVVEITTLPFFPITGAYWLDYPCILLANRLKLIGEKTEVSVLDQYLTGGYKIIGYSHSITEGRAESSFSLVRIPASQLNKLTKSGG